MQNPDYSKYSKQGLFSSISFILSFFFNYSIFISLFQLWYPHNNEPKGDANLEIGYHGISNHVNHPCLLLVY